MGKIYSLSNQKGGEIYSKALCRYGPCGPIIVDISTTHEERYGTGFLGLEKVLQESFFPRIFSGKLRTIPPVVGSLSMLMVKKSGLGLQNSMTFSKDKYNS